MVRYQVPRYSGWKRILLDVFRVVTTLSDTKYRDIADGNFSNAAGFSELQMKSDTKYRDIADGN